MCVVCASGLQCIIYRAWLVRVTAPTPTPATGYINSKPAIIGWNHRTPNWFSVLNVVCSGYSISINDKSMCCFMFKQWIERTDERTVEYMFVWRWLMCHENCSMTRWNDLLNYPIQYIELNMNGVFYIVYTQLDTIYLQQHNIFIITTTFNTIYLWGRVLEMCCCDACIDFIWIG